MGECAAAHCWMFEARAELKKKNPKKKPEGCRLGECKTGGSVQMLSGLLLEEMFRAR